MMIHCCVRVVLAIPEAVTSASSAECMASSSSLALRCTFRRSSFSTSDARVYCDTHQAHTHTVFRPTTAAWRHLIGLRALAPRIDPYPFLCAHHIDGNCQD
jgi:hypothetical protein